LLTTTFPLFAEAGTTTAMLVSFQLLMLADCPLILTALVVRQDWLARDSNRPVAPRLPRQSSNPAAAH